MPNHCFAHISVEKKYADKLREISKVGLCRHYLPMPGGLDLFEWFNKTHDNQYKRNGWGKFQEEQKEWIEHQKAVNKSLHGAEDWYTWCINNWGTKWGCYEGHFNEDDNGGSYSFSTAWSPVRNSVMYELLKDIPDLCYEWEEEQGYGEIHEYKKGQCVSFEEYGAPEWCTEKWENDERSQDEERFGFWTLTQLKQPHRGRRRGYYLEYEFETFMGDRYEDAVKRMEKLHKKLKS
jgi:hypothetical protein